MARLHAAMALAALVLAGCAAPSEPEPPTGTETGSPYTTIPPAGTSTPTTSSASSSTAASSALPTDFLVLVATGNLSQLPPSNGGGACGRPANRFASLDLDDTTLTVVRDNSSFSHDLDASTWLVMDDRVFYTKDESDCDWPLLWGQENESLSLAWGDLAVTAARGDGAITARGQALGPGQSATFHATTPQENGRHFEGDVLLRVYRWTDADVAVVDDESQVPDAAEGALWSFWDPSRD